MAPKRSGGGWSSIDSYSTCMGAFSYWASQANLAYYIVFLIIYVCISITLCILYKRSGPGKKLIGPVYMVSVLFAIMSLLLDFINLLMSECHVASAQDYNNMTIASTILYHLSSLGLLFAVLCQLNHLLHRAFASVARALKLIPFVLFAVMAALHIANIALTTYVYSSNTSSSRRLTPDFVTATQNFSVAARALYLVCIVASAGLALRTLSALRRARFSTGDLFTWVVALHVFMLVWAVLAVVLTALSTSSFYLDPAPSIALSYVLALFQALSFVALLPIAKHACWRHDAASVQQVYAPVVHGDVAYGHGAGGAQEYHHEAEFVGNAK